MTPEKDPNPTTSVEAGSKEERRLETNTSLGLVIVLALALLIGMACMWQTFEKGGEPSQVILFLGQFHPVVVHLPLTLLFVVFVMEVLSMFKRMRGLRQNTLFLLWLATLGASGAIVLGYMLKSSGEYGGERVVNHMWAGIGVAAGSLAALMLKCGCGETLLYRFVLTLTVVTLAIAGHLGGSITHGSDYLTKHMPETWRANPYLNGEAFRNWFGVKDEEDAALEREYAVYPDYVARIFEEKCAKCHGDAKQKGKLRLDTLEFVMRGAEGADVKTVIPGNAGGSELVARILLPADDDDVMPPSEEERRLTRDEIRLVQWWIDEGASPDLAVTEVADEEIVEILARLEPPDPLVVAAEKAAAERRIAEEAERKSVIESALKNVAERGYALRPISAQDEGLQFNAVNVADEFDDEALALFAPLAGSIEELQLARTKITDDSAALLGEMTALKKLHLEHTAITDATLEKLTGLDKLEYLNLYGTKVTDAGLEHIRKLENLKRIFLWQTEVTPQGAAMLRASIAGLYVDRGWKEPAAEAEEKPGADPGAKPDAEKKKED